MNALSSTVLADYTPRAMVLSSLSQAITASEINPGAVASVAAPIEVEQVESISVATVAKYFASFARAQSSNPRELRIGHHFVAAARAVPNLEVVANAFLNYDNLFSVGSHFSATSSLKEATSILLGEWQARETSQAEIVETLSQHQDATDSYEMDDGSIAVEFRNRPEMLVCIVGPDSFQMLWHDDGKFLSCSLPSQTFSTHAALMAFSSLSR